MINDLFNQSMHQQGLLPTNIKEKKLIKQSTAADSTRQPLADRLRPNTLYDIVGQDHLLGPDGIIRRMLEYKTLASFILWGQPGVGKTTIARVLAQEVQFEFKQISAVFSGVSELKSIFGAASQRLKQSKTATLLFVDEIHRFNRAQQDSFLPFVENGTVILVGATTENPSFSLNSALLSRCEVFTLNRLDNHALEQLLGRAERLTGRSLPLTAQARQVLLAMADGDGRYIINMAEQLFGLNIKELLDTKDVPKILSKRAVIYDRNQDEHYNLISALHKSLRGSDPDAALYWFARMLEGGEDPHYIARRLTRFAVEDIGLADPRTINAAIAAWEAYERLGSPEGELALAQLVIMLATAPKSNAVYSAYKKVKKFAQMTGSLMPPHHILNATTSLMKTIGYGKDYQYDHDMPEGFSGQNYFPDGMKRQQFYYPTDRGEEKLIAQRLDMWKSLRNRRQ